MVFEDRVSASPNTYTMTDANGNVSRVLLERADEPVIPGTPLNAETFNKMVEDIKNGTAPAGFGLGGGGEYVDISSLADIDNITANGWYCISIPDYIAETADFGGVTLDTAVMRVDSYGGNICRQTLYPSGNYATSIVRLKYINWDLTAKWSPWYVENPPMDFDVEYRTTERWQGSPVYVKCIKNPVGSDATTWNNVINSSYTVVGADFLYNNTPAPYYRGSDMYACPAFDGAHLNFWVDGGHIPGTLTATIRYVK